MNRNLNARITLEQLLALYTDPESHNPQHYRQTDRRTDRQTDRQTDGQQAAANSQSYCVAVRSAKNGVEADERILFGLYRSRLTNRFTCRSR